MLVTGKYNDQFVVAEVNKQEYEIGIKTGAHMASLPRAHTLWFEEGGPHVVVIEGARIATEQEAIMYNVSKFHFLNNNSSNAIWDTNGLMLNNYVKRSNASYWVPQFRGTICRITIDEMILIDTQVPRGIFEYIDLDDEWLDQFGFDVEKDKATLITTGGTFQLNKRSIYADVTDQNSAQIEANITNGAPIIIYELTVWSRAIRHVHTLQNIVSLLINEELVRRDGKR